MRISRLYEREDTDIMIKILYKIRRFHFFLYLKDLI